MRRRRAQHSDAQRVVEGLAKGGGTDHDLRLPGQGRLEDLQPSHSHAAGRQDRIRGVVGARRAAAAKEVAVVTRLIGTTLTIFLATAGAARVLAAGQQEYKPPA